MCLIFLFLTSCAPATASPPPEYASPLPPIPMSSAFVYTKECPHVCWLGINPGVTTTEDALVLLTSSSQIDQSSYIDDNETGIRVEWHTKQMGVNPIRVGMVYENGIVNSINFYFGIYVKLQEFIDLIGQPDEISISKNAAEMPRYMNYAVYYTSINALIFVNTTDMTGPDIDDSVTILYLNITPDEATPLSFMSGQNLRQPWLGFGHLEEYLKNRPSPNE